MERDINGWTPTVGECVLNTTNKSADNYHFYLHVSKILGNVLLSSSEVKEIKILHNDIREMLQNIWPGCEIKVFGSLVTGLAFSDSDMDVYVELPPRSRYQYDSDRCLVKTMVHVAWRAGEFENVSSAPLAKVPVITLKHVKTNRNCDITFSGSIAVETSKLVKYLLQSDSRAFKLAVLVKYWSKIYGLTATKRLSNSTMTLLLIFFLQQKKILPSVVSLQNNVPINDTEGWNTAFQRRVTYGSCNEESLYKLLGDFFIYYSTFNYEDLVVCPYLGYPVEKRTFLNPSLLPTEFKLYKEHVRSGCEPFKPNTTWCVQDPFEHNRINSVHVDVSLAWKIYWCFNSAVNCYRHFTSSDFLKNLELQTYRHFKFPIRTNTPNNNPCNQYTVTDGQIPQRGNSWKFYFCTAICFLILYSIFSHKP